MWAIANQPLKSRCSDVRTVSWKISWASLEDREISCLSGCLLDYDQLSMRPRCSFGAVLSACHVVRRQLHCQTHRIVIKFGKSTSTKLARFPSPGITNSAVWVARLLALLVVLSFSFWFSTTPKGFNPFHQFVFCDSRWSTGSAASKKLQIFLFSAINQAIQIELEDKLESDYPNYSNSFESV